ncbi:MAG: hypothetical protein K9J85_05255 [Desulfobacteraceae bacterium]|nr:hypothetical protein [Desulfobacteraceae bacterium]
MRTKAFFCLILLFSLLFLSACSFSAWRTAGRPDSPDKGPVQNRPESKEIPAEPEDREKIKETAAISPDTRDLLKKQDMERLIDRGDVLAALQGIDQNIRQGACNKNLSDSYIRALNSAIKQGRARLRENRPDQAGLLFRTVKNNFPQDAQLAARIPMSPAELDTEIARCADLLMEQGLVAYRKGQLGDAISIWNQILAFDPQYQAGRNAIKTAETQKSNLEKIGNNNEQKP